ncbi:MAG: hypothetical protein JO314_11790 [Acidobacteria bacterium]|nr:hypothetical protein [Acidobacteriota bacterium]
MATKKKMSRRTLTLLIMLAVSIVIGSLIYYEQISALYVLCTLALVTLLIVVGFSDLESVARTDPDSEGAK